MVLWEHGKGWGLWFWTLALFQPQCAMWQWKQHERVMVNCCWLCFKESGLVPSLLFQKWCCSNVVSYYVQSILLCFWFEALSWCLQICFVDWHRTCRPCRPCMVVMLRLWIWIPGRSRVPIIHFNMAPVGGVEHQCACLDIHLCLWMLWWWLAERNV